MIKAAGLFLFEFKPNNWIELTTTAHITKSVICILFWMGILYSAFCCFQNVSFKIKLY